MPGDDTEEPASFRNKKRSFFRHAFYFDVFLIDYTPATKSVRCNIYFAQTGPKSLSIFAIPAGLFLSYL